MAGCEGDEVTVSITPALVVYDIGDAAREITASVTQSVTDVECPLQCFLTQGGNALGNFDSNLFSLDCATYTVTIFTEN